MNTNTTYKPQNVMKDTICNFKQKNPLFELLMLFTVLHVIIVIQYKKIKSVRTCGVRLNEHKLAYRNGYLLSKLENHSLETDHVLDT